MLETIELKRPTSYPEQVKGYVKEIKDLNRRIPNKVAEQIARNLTARDLWQQHETKRAKKYEEISKIDPLTGFYNRRYLLGEENNKSDKVIRHKRVGALEREFDRAIRHSHNLTILMIDFDMFKEYNDRFGHQEGGDVLIKIFADAANDALRNEDIKTRYGGDEFCFILPETNSEEAIKIAQRLKEAYRDLQKRYLIKDLNTLSIGLSSLLSNQPRNYLELIKFADKALYEAKEKKGEVVVYGNK